MQKLKYLTIEIIIGRPIANSARKGICGAPAKNRGLWPISTNRYSRMSTLSPAHPCWSCSHVCRHEMLEILQVSSRQMVDYDFPHVESIESGLSLARDFVCVRTWLSFWPHCGPGPRLLSTDKVPFRG